MVETCLDSGVRTIGVDLSGLAFCDVCGLNAFLVAAQASTAAGGHLRLEHPNLSVMRLVIATGSGAVLLSPTGSAPAGPVPADPADDPWAVTWSGPEPDAP